MGVQCNQRVLFTSRLNKLGHDIMERHHTPPMPSNIFNIHDDLTFYDKRDNDVAAAAAAAVFVKLAS